jgi:hypothetical protein
VLTGANILRARNQCWDIDCRKILVWKFRLGILLSLEVVDILEVRKWRVANLVGRGYSLVGRGLRWNLDVVGEEVDCIGSRRIDDGSQLVELGMSSGDLLVLCLDGL